MAISYSKFLSWCEDRFGDVKVSGDEIKINSIFQDDYKHKMWCNPTKSGWEYGTYHCWKTDKAGNLVDLVRKVDKCSYEQALEILGAEDVELADLERRLETFMSSLTPSTLLDEKVNIDFKLPEHTFPIQSLPKDHLWRIEAEAYLNTRKLNPSEYCVCLDGKYKNRIIIPYYDSTGKLIYWNGRFLTNTDKVSKYLGPEKECGVGKGDVIFMATKEWPEKGKKLYITEGEFDAKSLVVAGLCGAAIGGKSIEEKQVEMIRDYVPVLCFDTDEGKKDAGGDALLKIGDTLKAKGFNEVYFVRPPLKYKDWNKMLVEVGPKVLLAYIKQNERSYTTETRLELTIQRI